MDTLGCGSLCLFGCKLAMLSLCGDSRVHPCTIFKCVHGCCAACNNHLQFDGQRVHACRLLAPVLPHQTRRYPCPGRSCRAIRRRWLAVGSLFPSLALLRLPFPCPALPCLVLLDLDERPIPPCVILSARASGRHTFLFLVWLPRVTHPPTNQPSTPSSLPPREGGDAPDQQGPAAAQGLLGVPVRQKGAGLDAEEGRLEAHLRRILD